MEGGHYQGMKKHRSRAWPDDEYLSCELALFTVDPCGGVGASEFEPSHDRRDDRLHRIWVLGSSCASPLPEVRKSDLDLSLGTWAARLFQPVCPALAAYEVFILRNQLSEA